MDIDRPRYIKDNKKLSFVSVVVPMYNEELYIKNCLLSLISQDYPKDCYEIIVIDGNSKDNSKKIVEEMQKKFPLIRIYNNSKRITTISFNVGINKAKGEIIIFIGAHGPANSLDTTLKAADRLRGNKDIEIVLVGDGILKESLLNRAKEMRLKNVRFFEPIPKTEIPGILSAADAAIITLNKIKVFSYGVSPNKLFDYMAARKPIICAVEGEMAEKIENIRCGISVIPEDDKSMAEAITHLTNLSADRLRQMGDNSYEEIKKNYSREKLAQKLINLIEQ